VGVRCPWAGDAVGAAAAGDVREGIVGVQRVHLCALMRWCHPFDPHIPGGSRTMDIPLCYTR